MEANDNAYKFNGGIPSDTYHKFCKNIYSQNGEDGIIEQLLLELNSSDNGYCCEFGASDGIASSNTYNLIKNHNFKSIQIEGDATRFENLKQTYKEYPEVKLYCKYVTSENLTTFLDENNYPADFDVLSIDVDSIDYEIWAGFTKYTPKIVVIEANSYRDPVCLELNNTVTASYNNQIDPLKEWHPGRIGNGASFMSIIKLGLEKSYTPVSFTGNIIFVHTPLISKLKQFPYKLSNNPYDYISLYTNLCMWNNDWYTNTGLILNTAIGCYYNKFQTENIDWGWVKNAMKKYGDNIYQFNTTQ